MQEKLEKDVPTLNNKFKELAIGKILVLLNNSKLCPFLLLKVPNNAYQNLLWKGKLKNISSYFRLCRTFEQKVFPTHFNRGDFSGHRQALFSQKDPYLQFSDQPPIWKGQTIDLFGR